MTRKKMTSLQRQTARWLRAQKIKWVTDCALHAVCLEVPRCAKPCDQCWEEASVIIRDKMLEIMERSSH